MCVVWNPEGFGSAWRTDDLLFGCGVVDFAGSGVVHMTGGVAAFVGAMLIGPRRAYLVNELKVPRYGPIFQTLGVFILWFGWFGFNGVSTLLFSGYTEVAAKAMVATTIAAGVGTVTTIVVGMMREGKDKKTGRYTIRLEHANNGALAGLVSITASCSVVEPYGAAIIAGTGGCVYLAACEFLEHYAIDDVVKAFPVHGAVSVGKKPLANIDNLPAYNTP